MDEAGSAEADQGGAGRRGRSHDAEGTREAILDAGEDVFAEHGFDGARVDAIAKASGYNKSLIFQYFGDKLGLYGAVIRRADEQTRQMQNHALTELRKPNALRDFPSLERLLRQYVAWYFDYAVEHPNVIRIFNWEMAEGWQTFGKVITERDYQDVEDFTPIFQRLQKAGLIRPKPTPLLQYTTALFSAHVILAILPLYDMLIRGSEIQSAETISQAREFVIEFVVSGLLTKPGKRPAPKPGKATQAAGQRKGGPGRH